MFGVSTKFYIRPCFVIGRKDHATPLDKRFDKSKLFNSFIRSNGIVINNSEVYFFLGILGETRLLWSSKLGIIVKFIFFLTFFI